MKLKKMFEPMIIRNTTVRNRFVVSSMVVSFIEEKGYATERFIAYHETKAKGGWGLIITEDYEIDEHVGGFMRLPGLYREDQIPGHRQLTERVHKHGAKIICQIYHAGREGSNVINKNGIVAPSPIKDPTIGDIPKELSISEIENIVEKFAITAKNAEKAGFDGVEIHGAHGYLVGEFLSPFSNKRTDRYGGSIEGRFRIVKEITEAIRKVTGPDFIIGMRFSTVEYVPGGLELAETKVIAQLAEDSGIDYIHASQGVYTTTEHVIAPSSTPRGNYIDNTKAIKEAVDIPVIAVGRINDPLIADNIIREGKADFVTMARASLADPYLPNKTFADNRDDIIRCIGCNQGCIGHNVLEIPVRCLVNPLQGMEYKYDFKKTDNPKKVLVAGGGVAGCEAAIVAAWKGHKVVLVEKQTKLGGQWHSASTPLGKGEFTSFMVWQRRELEKQSVEIRFNTEFNIELLKKEKPDTVVIATGSEANIIPIKGIETANVVTVEQALLGGINIGKKAVVVGGGSAGAETADHIRFHGCDEVIIIEILDSILNDMEAAPKKHLMYRMKNNEIKIYTGCKITEIESKRITVDTKNGEAVIIDDVDTVVMATGRKNDKKLEEELKALGTYEIYRVGDASKVKDGYHNIQEAFDVAYTI